jgi:tRNA 2-selenouridine synthase
MRSAGVAWLLDLYGFKVYTLTGGYKAYRRWVLAQFKKQYSFKIIGGYTGSGKTLILEELEKSERAIINLERLAVHKGSAFGALGQDKQPRQEMFENLLAKQLADTYNKLPGSKEEQIFIEDESQRIGNVIIPQLLWNTMRQSPIHFIDVPFEERLNYIIDAYGKYDKEELAASIIRIQKRLGGLDTKNALYYLEEGNFKACFKILLAYYDKLYAKGLQNRKDIGSLLTTMSCSTVDTKTNSFHFIQSQ